MSTTVRAVQSAFFRIALRILAAQIAVLAGVVAGCGGSSPEPVSAAGLPPYEGKEREVFDDSFAPEIFDLPSDRGSAAYDPKLGRRTRRADFVVRAKVITVSRDQRGDELTYHLVLRPVQAPISGRLQSETLELRLRPKTPSIRLVERHELTLTGKVLVLLGRFYNEKGEVVLHFRAEPNTAEVLEGVKRARVL